MRYSTRVIVSASILLLMALPVRAEEELVRFFCNAEKMVELKDNGAERSTTTDKFTVYMLPNIRKGELNGIFMVRTDLPVALHGSFDDNRFGAMGLIGQNHTYQLDIFRQNGMFLFTTISGDRVTQTIGECRREGKAEWMSQFSSIKPPPAIQMFPDFLSK